MLHDSVEGPGTMEHGRELNYKLFWGRKGSRKEGGEYNQKDDHLREPKFEQMQHFCEKN